MTYSYNPLSKRLDYNKHKEVKQLEDKFNIIDNESEHIFYVATTGSDITGNGTISSPFATIDKVLEFIPYNIKNNNCYVIKVANGTYDNFPNLNFNLGINSSIIIDGYEQAIEDHETEYTIDTIDIGDAFATINLSSSVFTIEEHYGKYILITSGSYAGYYFPIFKNTADSIITSNMLGYLLSNGDKFKVVVPGVNFINTEISILNIMGLNSSALFFNINITNDSSYEDILLNITGTSNFVFFCSSVNNTNGTNFNLIKAFTSNLNAYFLVSDNIKNNLSYLSLITAYPFGVESYLYYVCGLIIYDATNSHPVTDLLISYSKNTYINSIFVKGTILFYDGALVLEGALCNRLELLKTHGECILTSLGVFQDGEYIEFLRLSEYSNMKMNYCQFEGATNYVLNVVENSNIIKINDSTFVNATIEYFARIGFNCKIYLYDIPTSTNTINDVYFMRGSTASAFPIAGASVNDTECSYLAIKS